MGKTDGKRQIGKHSRRWENNIRVDFKNLDKKRGFGSYADDVEK
jgi:hypothetical protein